MHISIKRQLGPGKNVQKQFVKKKQQRKPESTRTTGQWTPMCETRFVESRLAAAAAAAPDAERLTI